MNSNEQLKFMFLDKETSEVVNPQSATFNIDGSFNKLKGFTNTGVTAEYDVQKELICLSNYIFVPNIGKIYEGDKELEYIKNTFDNKRYYTLNYYYKKKYNTKVCKISLNANSLISVLLIFSIFTNLVNSPPFFIKF